MLLHFQRDVRPAVAALWTIDEALGAVVADASQPALAAIKLAWWREALERLDSRPAPAEPRLQAVADELLPRGITGAAIAGLEPGWAELLQDRPVPAAVASRGECLFELEARLLGGDGATLRAPGAVFALVDAVRRGYAAVEPSVAAARRHAARQRIPRRLRPVTIAARLAARPLAEPEGTPARAIAMITHRLTGIIARVD